MATAKDRQSLAVWEEFHKSLLRGVEVDNSLTRQDIERQRAQLERDPIEWIKFFFPAYAKYEFAPFHIRAIRRVIANDEWYEVLSWSRELAKSTVAMFILMFLTLTRRKRFVALASATIDSAKRLLLPFKINFESNPRIRQFYGEQTTIGQWTDSEFSCRCGAKFIALGAGSAPRGMRNEAIRPDILYFDDYDTDEDCRNPVTLDKKWDWAEHALYPTRSISEPTLVLWCGNIIAKDCCITRAGHLANSWDIVNIRDAAGRSTWPQKNKEEQIDRILSKISVKAQQGEYFNNPVAEGKIFKNLPYGKVPPLSKFRFLIGYGDPAYSDSRKRPRQQKRSFLSASSRGSTMSSRLSSPARPMPTSYPGILPWTIMSHIKPMSIGIWRTTSYRTRFSTRSSDRCYGSSAATDDGSFTSRATTAKRQTRLRASRLISNLSTESVVGSSTSRNGTTP